MRSTRKRRNVESWDAHSMVRHFICGKELEENLWDEVFWLSYQRRIWHSLSDPYRSTPV